MGTCYAKQWAIYPIPVEKNGFAFFPKHGYSQLLSGLVANVDHISVEDPETDAEYTNLWRSRVRDLSRLRNKTPGALTDEDIEKIIEVSLIFREALGKMKITVGGHFNFNEHKYSEKLIGPSLSSRQIGKIQNVFRIFDGLCTGVIEQPDIIKWMKMRNDGLCATIFTKGLFLVNNTLEKERLNFAEFVLAVENFCMLSEEELSELCFRVLQNRYSEATGEWLCDFKLLQQSLQQESSDIVESDHILLSYFSKFIKRLSNVKVHKDHKNALTLSNFVELCKEKGAKVIIFPIIWFQNKLWIMTFGKSYWKKRRNSSLGFRKQNNLRTNLLRDFGPPDDDSSPILGPMSPPTTGRTFNDSEELSSFNSNATHTSNSTVFLNGNVHSRNKARRLSSTSGHTSISSSTRRNTNTSSHTTHSRKSSLAKSSFKAKSRKPRSVKAITSPDLYRTHNNTKAGRRLSSLDQESSSTMDSQIMSMTDSEYLKINPSGKLAHLKDTSNDSQHDSLLKLPPKINVLSFDSNIHLDSCIKPPIRSSTLPIKNKQPPAFAKPINSTGGARNLSKPTKSIMKKGTSLTSLHHFADGSSLTNGSITFAKHRQYISTSLQSHFNNSKPFTIGTGPKNTNTSSNTRNSYSRGRKSNIRKKQKIRIGV
eukprot:TRINITY_DN775997_c0_g1_i1.p1 TRINITY_DN775997_c0_g1~~TRINITY_DN775997_c0_g1_i1.p1  ORF type:complete len:651 (-),score=126.19 TRINITY_DN775997_c0_g1_i1:127-2079(-)